MSTFDDAFDADRELVRDRAASAASIGRGEHGQAR